MKLSDNQEKPIAHNVWYLSGYICWYYVSLVLLLILVNNKLKSDLSFISLKILIFHFQIYI